MRVVHPIQPAAMARVDAGFLDPAYARLHPRGSQHPGVDYNLHNTAGNGDLGYPVVAMADGIVRHAAQHRVWGNVVLIEHPGLARTLGLPYLATQYAHLHFMSVVPGQRIWAGEAVGSIGRGDPRAPFLAHLHFEVRRQELAPDYWPHQDVAAIRSAYLDPVAFLRQHGDARMRFQRDRLVLSTQGGNQIFSGTVIVNVDGETAHVAVR